MIILLAQRTKGFQMSREIITIDNNNNLHVVVETDAMHPANRTGSGAVPTLRRYNHKLKGGEVVVQAYHDGELRYFEFIDQS